MTGVEGTYLTLTAILFQVGVNNSLNFFAVTNIREKNLPSFLSYRIYIIPWFVTIQFSDIQSADVSEVV